MVVVVVLFGGMEGMVAMVVTALHPQARAFVSQVQPPPVLSQVVVLYSHAAWAIIIPLPSKTVKMSEIVEHV